MSSKARQQGRAELSLEIGDEGDIKKEEGDPAWMDGGAPARESQWEGGASKEWSEVKNSVEKTVRNKAG